MSKYIQLSSTYKELLASFIIDMVQVLEEFNNILCPDLRAVTSDPHRMDDVKQRVKNLVVPFEAVAFDIFSTR